MPCPVSVSNVFYTCCLDIACAYPSWWAWSSNDKWQKSESYFKKLLQSLFRHLAVVLDLNKKASSFLHMFFSLGLSGQTNQCGGKMRISLSMITTTVFQGRSLLLGELWTPDLGPAEPSWVTFIPNHRARWHVRLEFGLWNESLGLLVLSISCSRILIFYFIS